MGDRGMFLRVCHEWSLGFMGSFEESNNALVNSL